MKKTISLFLTIACILTLSSVGSISFAEEMTNAEAPMLTELVEAGELPSRDERMPEVPAVYNDIPEDILTPEIGIYGGTLRDQQTSPDETYRENMLSYPGYVYSLADLTGNILEGFEFNEDGSVFTFHMRKGLKWSDGSPVTTEDVRFYWEDVINNEELTPSGVPDRFCYEGTPMELVIVDEYTYQYVYAGPMPSILMNMSSKLWTYASFITCDEYFKQFHVDYADADELAEMVSEAGVDDWTQLFELRADQAEEDSGVVRAPTLMPFVLTYRSATELVYTRNPYYFKVDAAGNQLPYIDYVIKPIYTNDDMAKIALMNGDDDFARGGIDMMFTYADYTESGNFHLIPLDGVACTETFYFNYNYEDEVWQSVIQDARFRNALNYALDKQLFINSFKSGYADLPDFIPTEYDVEKANALLDEMGMLDIGGDGWREAPSGEAFVIEFQYASYVGGWDTALQLAFDCWSDIGVNCSMSATENTLFAERAEANQIMATICWCHPGNWPYVLSDWSPVFPGSDLHRLLWCPLWRDYYLTSGASGEECTMPDVQELMELTTVMYTTLDASEQEAAWARVEELWYENVYYIPTCMNVKEAIYVKNTLKNVPETGLQLLSTFGGEIYYFDEN